MATYQMRGKSRKASGLPIARGIVLVLLAVVFAYFAVGVMPDGPTRRNPMADAGADTTWRAYFLAALALCVVALILGILSFVRPRALPVASVVTGAAVMLVGLVGCAFGLLSVGNGTDMGTPLTFMSYGFFFGAAGTVTTVLSAIALAVMRRHKSSAGGASTK